jgi:hypothetical protein
VIRIDATTTINLHARDDNDQACVEVQVNEKPYSRLYGEDAEATRRWFEQERESK